MLSIWAYPYSFIPHAPHTPNLNSLTSPYHVPQPCTHATPLFPHKSSQPSFSHKGPKLQLLFLSLCGGEGGQRLVRIVYEKWWNERSVVVSFSTRKWWNEDDGSCRTRYPRGVGRSQRFEVLVPVCRFGLCIFYSRCG